MESIINAIIENDYEWFVELIEQKGGDISDKNGFTPLMYCLQNGRNEMTHFLLKKDIDVNKKNNVGNNALFYAVFHSKNQTEIIEELLKKGADKNSVNNSGVSPLSLANSMSNEKVKTFINNWISTKC